jgi:hypothetical protein
LEQDNEEKGRGCQIEMYVGNNATTYAAIFQTRSHKAVPGEHNDLVNDSGSLDIVLLA